MIQVENLSKYYGDYPAIEGVTFRVEKGEIMGFLGPNGAGKTTTMRILTGYMPPSSGAARVAGYDVFAESLEARKHIGYLPESVPLYTDMSVRSYLQFMARLRGARKNQARLDEVMEKVNLQDEADTLIGHLSKGYRQRVGLAQALIHDPDVLILDEPTIGLDPRQVREVRELIKGLAGEHTVILSTHILSEASQLCGRILIINNGHIVAEDTPERLTASLKGNDRILIRTQKTPENLEGELAKIEGISSVEPTADGAFELSCAAGQDRRAEIAAVVVQRGWGLLELRPLVMGLEEIFLKLTQDSSLTQDNSLTQESAPSDMAGEEEESHA